MTLPTLTKREKLILASVVFALTLFWGVVGAYVWVKSKQYSFTSLHETAASSSSVTPSDLTKTPIHTAMVLVQQFQQAAKDYRNEKGFTKDIPLIIFDVRSEKDYLKRHIKNASLTPIGNLKAIADSGFLDDKTVIIVVSDNTQEDQARTSLADVRTKELIIWPASIMDTLSSDLIEENVEM